jgi:tripartite-type tricarboxylate transporter receptor subunit TctC
MLIYKTILLATAAAGLVATGSLAPVSAADYSGKTFTMIVGASPAGGQTRGARAWARHLGKFMPGNPKFIVKNLPGAAGNKSKNFIYNKEKKTA